LWRNPGRRGDPQTLSTIDRALLDFTLKQNTRISGKQLSAMSHEYPEWIESRMGLSPTARGNQKITIGAVRTALSKEQRLEDNGATVVIPTPLTPEVIGSMKTRIKEITFFGQVVKPLMRPQL
jgi:hypothetical protein